MTDTTAPQPSADAAEELMWSLDGYGNDYIPDSMEKQDAEKIRAALAEAVEKARYEMSLSLSADLARARAEERERILTIIWKHEGCPVIRGGNICGCERLIAAQVDPNDVDHAAAIRRRSDRAQEGKG